MRNFEYIKVSAIDEALDLLDKYRADAKLLAGGSDLLLQMRQQSIDLSYLIDLKGISNLSSIKQEGNILAIGTLVTLRDIEKSEIIQTKFSALTDGVRKISSVQLRNIATLGGNLCQTIKCPYYNQSHRNLFMRGAIKPCFRKGGNVCHAVTWGNDVNNTIVDSSYCKAPLASDMAIALAALGGSVELVAREGSREINVTDLYKEDSTLDLNPGEILIRIKIPMVSRATAFLVYKSSQYAYTLASAAVSLSLHKDKTCQDIKVYLGGVASQPYEAKGVEGHIKGRELDEEVIEEATQLLFKDTKATNNAIMFKIAKSRDLCREAITKAWERVQGK